MKSFAHNTKALASLQALLGDDVGALDDDAVDRLPVGVYVCDRQGRVVDYNETAVELWGRRPDLSDPTEMYCGSYRMHTTDGQPIPHNACALAIVLATGQGLRNQELVIERHDGTRLAALASIEPIRDEAGRLLGAVNSFRAKGGIPAEREASELAAQRLAAIIESSQDAILAKDLNGIITDWNPAAQNLFGYTADEAIGKPVTMLIPADRQDEEAVILASIRRGERVEHYETVRQRKDGSLVDISLTISPIRTTDGTIVGASKIARDITDRKRAQQQQHLLLQEMNHRTKNLLTLCSGLVALSARYAETPEGLARAVQERLQALARAHELILPQADAADDNAPRSTSLHTLIGTILSPYGETDGLKRPNIVISGSDITLSGRAVTGLALLLHEFATNAAKYGALSSGGGRIEIACIDAGDQFVIEWRELGGPNINNENVGEGFGSRLSRATVERQFGGTISREWDAQGLRIRLSVPQRSLT